MKLSNQQALFTSQINALILVVNSTPGFRVRDGDCYRDKRCKYGHSKSLHRSRLARDLILDKWNPTKKKWVCQTSTKSHKWIGKIWETMHPLNRWGGSFGDGNHYSSSRGGIK